MSRQQTVRSCHTCATVALLQLPNSKCFRSTLSLIQLCCMLTFGSTAAAPFTHPQCCHQQKLRHCTHRRPMLLSMRCLGGLHAHRAFSGSQHSAIKLPVIRQSWGALAPSRRLQVALPALMDVAHAACGVILWTRQRDV